MAENDSLILFVVYLVTCLVSGHRYVGKTKSPETRWRDHVWHSRRPKYPLHHAIRKHGEGSFLFEVLSWHGTEDEAFEAERASIVKYGTRAPNGYNLTDGGEGVSGAVPGRGRRRKDGLPQGSGDLAKALRPCRKPFSRQCLTRSEWFALHPPKPRNLKAQLAGLRRANAQRAEDSLVRDAELVERVLAGEPQRAIAAETGVSRKHLWRVLRRVGVSGGPQGRGEKSL